MGQPSRYYLTRSSAESHEAAVSAAALLPGVLAEKSSLPSSFRFWEEFFSLRLWNWGFWLFAFFFIWGEWCSPPSGPINCTQFLEVIHSSLPRRHLQHSCLFIKLTWEDSSSRLLKWTCVWYSIITSVTSHHLYCILVVRGSKS